MHPRSPGRGWRDPARVTANEPIGVGTGHQRILYQRQRGGGIDGAACCPEAQQPDIAGHGKSERCGDRG